jgi:DNA-directed RNA polymerase specialized sigma subunit/DNA-binding CsgD family transcriptional regulator
MSAVICLMNREWYENFNLKNVGQIAVPQPRKKSQRTKNIKSGKSTNKNQPNRLSFDDLNIPFDLDLFKNCSFHKDNDPFSTISRCTLEEARKEFYNIKWTQITPQIIEEVLKLNSAGKTSYEISEQIGCSRASINIVLKKNDEKTFAKLKQEKITEEVLKNYHDGTKPGLNEIFRRTGYFPPTIKKVFLENNLKSWEVLNIKTAEEAVIKVYSSGKKPSISQIAKSTGLHEGRVNQILKRFKLEDWYKKEIEERNKNILKLYKNGKKWSNERIAKELGCSNTSVCNFLKSKGIVSWDVLEREKKDKIISKLYNNGEKLGNKEIAKLANVTEAVVKAWQKRNRLENWTNVRLEEIKQINLSLTDQFSKIYHNGNFPTDTEISKLMGITKEKASQLRRSLNLEPWINLKYEKDSQVLLNLFLEKGIKSPTELSKVTGLERGRVRGILRLKKLIK